MTEPSAEALQFAAEHYWPDIDWSDGAAESFVEEDEKCLKMAAEIDALTEKRVAAAVQEERERCAGIAAFRKTDAETEQHNSPPGEMKAAWTWATDTAKIIEDEIRAADCPAPEGAAPTRGIPVEIALKPTQTVAAPGPTAGDVEPSAQDEKLAINELAQFAADGFFEVQSDAEARNVRHVKRLSLAFAKARAEAHAELLAQIREPSEELLNELRGGIGDSQRPPLDSKALKFGLRALADKLTEAK